MGPKPRQHRGHGSILLVLLKFEVIFRILEALETRLRGLKLKLAFISDHTQKLSEALNSLQGTGDANTPFVYDRIMNVRADFTELSGADAVFSPAVEELLKAYKDAAASRSFLSKVAKRAVVHIDNVMAKRPDQWKFYKQVRILNPVNLGDMQHDLPSFTHLHFPTSNESFRTEWHQYCRVENNAINTPTALAAFWANRGGELAKLARFLIYVPVTSAGVKRSFSLAGNMDTKYRHGLPNATRHITNMLVFNGDIEGRFNPA